MAQDLRNRSMLQHRTQQKSFLDKLAQRGLEHLIIDIVIFVACGAAMIVNLIQNHVGLEALAQPGSENGQLMLLTLVVVAVCAIAAVVFVMAVARAKRSGK